jgi:L-serine dehydratase
MYKVGQMLPSDLRCTGKGGLSVTPTGIKIFEKLNDRKQGDNIG